MFYTSFVITVGIVLYSANAEMTYTGQFVNLSPNNKVKLGESLEFKCTFNAPVSVVLQSNMHIYRKAGDKKVILTEAARLLDDAPPEFYSVALDKNLNYAGDSFTVLFNIIKVRDIDDGKLYCSLSNTGGSKEYSVDIVVLRPLTDLKLVLDGLSPIHTTQDSQIEVKSGIHQVQCIAEGSNPAAKSVELYLHGLKHDAGTVSSEIMGGELTKYRTTLKASVNIASSHSGQDLECKATSEYGDSKSVKVPLKVIIEEPEVECNETEAYLGQRDTKIICEVNHLNSRLKSFKYQVNDDIYEAGDNRDLIHYVQTEDLTEDENSPKVTKVTLTLQKTEASHFEQSIYLLAVHDDGHITRMPITLKQIEGDIESDGHNGRDDGNTSNVIIVSHAVLWLSLMFVLARLF